ncbi:MAG: hypothetical protein BAA02_13595 [Paenibacillaceae bacterium ZCTH02-B3]|nr:MAG: hypothetical protein BAA02_13595 [Paenibacillaceae bacterium ZCTH02-B3]
MLVPRIFGQKQNLFRRVVKDFRFPVLRPEFGVERQSHAGAVQKHLPRKHRLVPQAAFVRARMGAKLVPQSESRLPEALLPRPVAEREEQPSAVDVVQNVIFRIVPLNLPFFVRQGRNAAVKAIEIFVVPRLTPHFQDARSAVLTQRSSSSRGGTTRFYDFL